MGSRDKRRREPKKQKKTSEKGLSPSIVQPLPPVEVVRKPRKEREEKE